MFVHAFYIKLPHMISLVYESQVEPVPHHPPLAISSPHSVSFSRPPLNV